jgi:hypothetical protein
VLRPALAAAVAIALASCTPPATPLQELPVPDAGEVSDAPDGDGAGPDADAKADAAKDAPKETAPADPGDAGSPDGCVPDCWIRVCGPDGCGGTCGKCPSGTVCGHDQTLCVATSVQEPLGGACGETESCAEIVRDPVRPELRYYDPTWPACMHDQCLEGPCLEGFCSRSCVVRRDAVHNGTGVAGPDGVEDPDTTDSDCAGGKTVIFTAGFACVATEAASGVEPPVGNCYPRASFAPCERPADCPEGEACGFMPVAGTVETRCLARPLDGGGAAAPCGYDAKTGATRPCASWACSVDGCTSPCVDDADCATAGASCDEVAAECAGTLLPCISDTDCSAWRCAEGVDLPDPAGSYKACAPRACATDTDCGDPGWYCLLAPVNGDPEQGVAGRCSPRTAGGAGLMEPCDDTPGDGLPDVVCADRAWCVFHRCGAACASDADCSADGSARCGAVAFGIDTNFDGETDRTYFAPVCEHLGAGAAPCQTQADCAAGTCTPWIPIADAAVSLECMEPPPGGATIGALCGEAAWGATCASRACLGERPSEGVPGWCSEPCLTSADCPESLPVGPAERKWLCEARLFADAGTRYRPDDLYVSWCTPVPAASSLAPCGDTLACAASDEACVASVRAGAPGGAVTVSLICVRPDLQVGVGVPCDPAKGGADCGAGSCAPSLIEDVGFCTRTCATDDDCGGLSGFGGMARCLERVVIPAADPADQVAIKECRVGDRCVACRDDWDCGPDLRCVDVSTSTYLPDWRCAPACEADQDCVDAGAGAACLDVSSPPASAPDGTAKACAGISC